MIYFVRHGQSTTNAQGLLVGRSDPELTDHGRAQARALRPWLEGVEQVWTSPLRRAHETAMLAVPDVTPIVVHDVIEVDYGILDGTPLAHVTEEQWRAFEADHNVAMGGGESLHEVDRRVQGLLGREVDNPESLLWSADRHLLIVSHVSPIKSAATWAMGVPGSTAWRMRIDNGSLTAIGARRGTPTLVHANVVPALV
jgi:probable phosphoglycerate mutase